MQHPLFPHMLDLEHRRRVLCLQSALHLPDGKPILVSHHDGQLFTWVCHLTLASSPCVAVHSALHSGGASTELGQAKVVPQLRKACRDHSKAHMQESRC